MEMLWVHLLDFLSGMLLVYQLVLLRDFLVGIAEGDDLGAFASFSVSGVVGVLDVIAVGDAM